jgi:hypothetical protein
LGFGFGRIWNGFGIFKDYSLGFRRNKMALKKSGLNFTLKVMENGQEVSRVQTHSLRVFLNRARTINWQNPHILVGLRVSYGKYEDVFGKMVTFYNEGEYDKKKDFALAANAFINADTPAGTPEAIYEY